MSSIYQKGRMAVLTVGIALLGGLFANLTYAQTTSLQVAYPAGGAADVATRQIQSGLSAALKQPVIIENRPGAGGSIGATSVLRAEPGGQTLLVTTGNDLILGPLAMSQMKYKPEDFRMLGTIFPTDFLLVTNANHSFKSLDDLVEQARASKDELTAGSWGYGSAPYLVSADFAMATGVRLLDIPYKGAAPVVQALLSKEIDLAFVPIAASIIEFINQGLIKPIGTANTQRNPFLPNVPTLNESKYLNDFVYSAWAAIFVPRSVPESKADELAKALASAVSSNTFQQFLEGSAALPVKAMSLQESDAYFQSEMEKFRRIAKQINLVPR